MALSPEDRAKAIDELEKLFIKYVDEEQLRLSAEHNFLSSIHETLSIEHSAARRSKEIDHAKTLVSVKLLLPSSG